MTFKRLIILVVFSLYKNKKHKAGDGEHFNAVKEQNATTEKFS